MNLKANVGKILGVLGLALNGAAMVVEMFAQKQEIAEAAEKAVEKLLKGK